MATTSADGGVTVMFGGVEMTIPSGGGVFPTGVHVRMAATVRGTVTTEAADPTIGSLAVTELAFGTDEDLSVADRASLREVLVLMAWHMASFALNDAGPALPIGSIATTTDFEAYGVTPNTVLGTLSPSAIDGRFALEGAFGIVAPDM